MTYRTNWAQSERLDLCELLDRVGPDHETLCGDWKTADLAAHIVLRERRPDAAAGIILPALASRTEKVMEEFKLLPWADLVDLIRQGAPRWNPMSFGPVDMIANTFEFFVHHEDVLRAHSDWAPRNLDPEFEKLLWSRLKTSAPLLWRRAKVAVTLSNHIDQITAKKSKTSSGVLVSGETGELVLKSYGRTACNVTVTGDDSEVAIFNETKLNV